DPPKDPPEVSMADNQTMAELLQAPTEGYEDAIIIPEITANNSKLKHGLINLVQNKQFFGHDKEDPHAHIRYFNKITSTMKVPNFFPPSKTKNLRNEIKRFQQRFDESFYEAWERFNDLFRACPHHGFSELHQLDTFYNALNVNDQDSLNSTAGGNFLDKMPRECLKIIESKFKVRQTRAKAVVAKTRKTNPQLQLHLLLLLQLKQLSRIALLTVVLTRTKIVPLQAEMFIETTSKSMYHKPSQQITTKETPVSDLRWLQIKFDLPVFLPIKIIRNNFNRGNNFNQNRGGNFNQSNFNQGGNFNQGQLLRPQVNQPPAYQAPAYQAPIPQTQIVSKTDFESYVKANDAVLRNMQNQGQNLQIQMANLTDMLSKFGITTRSDVAYQRPTIPTPSKVMKQGTLVTKDQVQTPSSQSTAPVQPPVAQSETQTPVFEPVIAPVSIPMPNLKPSIPYPSRRDSERRRLSLSELTPTCMTLELSDRLVSKPISVAKDVSVKTDRALIDVHKGELTLRIRNEAITYNLDQTSRYSANYNQMTTNKIDVICEEYSQEVLGFSDDTASGNPTPYDDPIVSTTYPTLTPFGDSDFLLFEEADAFLDLEDYPNSPEFNPFYYDPEGDIRLLEAILNSKPLPPSPIMNNICLRSRKNSRCVKPKLLNLPLMNL
nr:hypothetical protein [Tanacetum cinerariifolium]